MFIVDIWQTWLYEPLFNALIYIYNNWTDQNLGWAVIYLTIIIRVLILPFSFIDEFKKSKNDAVFKKVDQLRKEFKNDSVMQKQEIRRLLKKQKVSPWAKAVVLVIQAVVFLLLYQVFIGGVKGEKVIKILYSFVEFPGAINTNFYGFDLAARYDILWSGAVTLLVVFNIYLGFRRNKDGLNKSDLAYFVLFPLAVFIFLWILPMVKALFFLTTMLFGTILHQFSRVIFKSKGP